MLDRFEPNVKITIAFLKLLKVNVNNSTVNETLQNHPDWPSLLCISDSLNEWNVENAAGKVEVSDIDQVPSPFMALTNRIENPLEIVTEVNGKEVRLYSISKNRSIIESKESFLKRWKGIYLIAEKSEKSGERDFKLKKKRAFNRSLIPISLFVLLTTISFLFLIRNLESSEIVVDYPIYIQFVILMVGVFVTTLLLWYEIDNDNPLLHKVCTGIVKGNCDAILNGKQSKLFSWLSWSEVGFFYFAGGLLTLLFIEPFINSFVIIAFLNILALPYSIFSVYYQGRVAKQWCIFCLAVQLLLIFGGINVIANGLLLTKQQISTFLFLKSILPYFTPALLWYAIKPYLLRLQEAKNTKREYFRIKFNSEIFETLLKKQKQITFSIEGLGIDLGNPKATNAIVKVCSPYCKPCSRAHPKIEKLLEEISNLKVKIIFTTPNDPVQKAYKPVCHLMAIAAQNFYEKETKHALDDWYQTDNKDYERFAAKYPMLGELNKQGEKLEAMYNWNNNMEVQFTPTIFINGYQLPEAYDIEDLKYFLLE